MKIKMILPALTEATAAGYRPIKYSLFPPLGLATLAGHCDPDDEIELCDEHVETLDLDDTGDDRPDLVVIQVYITAARRSYEIASFVFGMDDDDESVFDRTVEWALAQGIETATFHIMTPYPGTGLYRRMQAEGRILHSDWDSYDTHHVVYRPRRMTAEQLEAGYWRAYESFYSWGSIVRSASTKPAMRGRARHVAYSGGWKKFEPLWDLAIRARRMPLLLPVLERVLDGWERRGGPDRQQPIKPEQNVPPVNEPVLVGSGSRDPVESIPVALTAVGVTPRRG